MPSILVSQKGEELCLIANKIEENNCYDKVCLKKNEYTIHRSKSKIII